MSTAQETINTLLRKSLSGELIDTQFYLFSSRSKRGAQISKPQSLFANNDALTMNSQYFAKLLTAKSLSEPTFVELQDYHTCQETISLDDYGYASDSDLDEDEDSSVHDEQKITGLAQTVPTKNLATNEVQRTIPSRRILVTDTAFNTWQALLFYLYTDEIRFAPLRSEQNQSPKCVSFEEPPPCSPKSMYRLASKVDDDELRDRALAAIRSSLTEDNVVQELSSSLASRFPPILEMEVEILFEHITTPTVKKDLPTLMRKIAGSGLSHGAAILIKYHERMLSQYNPSVQACPSVQAHPSVPARSRAAR